MFFQLSTISVRLLQNLERFRKEHIQKTNVNVPLCPKVFIQCLYVYIYILVQCMYMYMAWIPSSTFDSVTN